MAKFLESLRKQYGNKLQRIFEAKTIANAVKVYKTIGDLLRNQRTSANQIMGSDSEKLRGSLMPEHIGKLIMFFYDPKLKEELPYYDRNPLIIPISLEADGFIGINFHYLHPLLRARLLDDILSISDYQFLKDPELARYNRFARRQLNMTYRKLQAACRSNYYKPCIKKYLFNHVRSRFYLVDPVDWANLLPLPLERFEKKTASQVWAISVKKAGI